MGSEDAASVFRQDAGDAFHREHGVDGPRRLGHLGQQAGAVPLDFSGAGEAFLGLLLLGDVGVSAEPEKDLARRLAEWIDEGEKWSEHPVGSFDRKNHVERLASRDGFRPPSEHFWQLVGVVDVLPTPTFHRLGRGAGVVIPTAVVPKNMSIGARHPSEVRDGVSKQTKSLLASFECFCGEFGGGDIPVINSDGATKGRRSIQLEPAVPWFVVVLETYRHALGGAAQELTVNDGADGGGIHFPMIFTKVVLAALVVDPLGGGIHVSDPPLAIEEEKSVADAFEDISHTLLALAEGLFVDDLGYRSLGFLAVGDVVHRDHGTKLLAVCIVERLTTCEQRARLATRRRDHHLGVFDKLASQGPEKRHIVLGERGLAVSSEEVVVPRPFLRRQRFLREAVKVFRRPVKQGKHPVLVTGDDAIFDILQHGFEEKLLLLEFGGPLLLLGGGFDFPPFGRAKLLLAAVEFGEELHLSREDRWDHRGGQTIHRAESECFFYGKARAIGSSQKNDGRAA